MYRLSVTESVNSTVTTWPPKNTHNLHTLLTNPLQNVINDDGRWWRERERDSKYKHESNTNSRTKKKIFLKNSCVFSIFFFLIVCVFVWVGGVCLRRDYIFVIEKDTIDMLMWLFFILKSKWTYIICKHMHTYPS